MTLLSVLIDLCNLGTTFPALLKKRFNDISFKFYFDLNPFANEPFLVLRVRREDERSFIFENKLQVGVPQTIEKSIRILPVFIKLMYQERWIEEFNKISDPEQPNQILFLTKVRDLV